MTTPFEVVRDEVLDDAVPRLVNLRRVAEQLDTTREVLIDLERSGRFPPLVWLSERRAFVRVDQLREWFRRVELAGNPADARGAFAAAVGEGSAMPRVDLPPGRRETPAARRPKPASRELRGVDHNPQRDRSEAPRAARDPCRLPVQGRAAAPGPGGGARDESICADTGRSLR